MLSRFLAEHVNVLLFIILCVFFAFIIYEVIEFLKQQR